jgi:basic amino acid/polyamine antiporter, APA family
VADRAAIATSGAPLATLFATLTGMPPGVISAIAAISMINGILVQIVVVSRVFYGMATDGLLPAALSAVDRRRQTPVRATLLAAAMIAALTVVAPMLSLARATGYITLALFAFINLSLLRLPGPWRERAWGAVGTLLSGGLLAYELVRIAPG